MRCVLRLQAMLILAVVAATHIDAARAEIRVEGDVGAFRLEAADASVDDILASLRDRFGLSFSSASALTRRVTATFEGPLARVVPHVLEGYDFVIKPKGANIEVIVLSSGSPRAARSPAPNILRRVD